MANTWILIRHPDKEGDKEGVYLGDTARITDRGTREIPLIISRLKVLLPNVVTCSLFPRTQTLAKRISDELNVLGPIAHGLFNEIDKPRFLVGLSRKDPVHVEVMQAIRDGFNDDTVPTHLLRGEKIKTRSEVEDEVRRAFLIIENFKPGIDSSESPTILTVSHAKRIAAYVHYVYRNDGTLTDYYTQADRALKISTTGITILCRHPNRRTGELQWHIATLNEDSHIEMGLHDEFLSLLKNVS